MAGLLAWAADVVAGVGDGANGESPVVPTFSPQQLEEMAALSSKRAALQQSLRQLRQRLPHPHIAQRLPHLHADSVASQSALAMELHAHSATRIQLQMRESSLRAENIAYGKALAARQQEAEERAQEVQHLEAELQELAALEKNLNQQLENLMDEERSKKVVEMHIHQEPFLISSENIRSEEHVEAQEQEVQMLQTELETWQAKVADLQKELMTAEQNSARWPSSAQREKELERRLRSLTEQLMAKQTQAESLARERNDLELRVEQASEARRHLSMGISDFSSKRNKIGQVRAPSSSSVSMLPSTSLAPKQRPGKLSTNSLGSKLGSQSRKILWRSSIVAYVVGLHVVAFIILSSRRIGGLH